MAINKHYENEGIGKNLTQEIHIKTHEINKTNERQ